MPQVKFKLYKNSYFLSAYAKHCSWETLDPYSDFINWAAEKIDSTHTRYSKYTQKMFVEFNERKRFLLRKELVRKQLHPSGAPWHCVEKLRFGGDWWSFLWSLTTGQQERACHAHWSERWWGSRMKRGKIQFPCIQERLVPESAPQISEPTDAQVP